VKLHLIAEKVTDAPWSAAFSQVDHSSRPPAMFYLKSLQSQLHDFRSNTPVEIADNSKSPQIRLLPRLRSFFSDFNE
jgi:hypothetical protein